MLARPRTTSVMTVEALVQGPVEIWTESLTVDFAERSFAMSIDGKPQAHYRDGHLTSIDGTHPAQFEEAPASAALGLLLPTSMMTWGRALDPAIPIYLEPVAHGDLLITFEHINHPAQRSTATWSERFSIFTEWVQFNSLCRIVRIDGHSVG